jgi:hypothetical protein
VENGEVPRTLVQFHPGVTPLYKKLTQKIYKKRNRVCYFGPYFLILELYFCFLYYYLGRMTLSYLKNTLSTGCESLSFPRSGLKFKILLLILYVQRMGADAERFLRETRQETIPQHHTVCSHHHRPYWFQVI